MLVLAPKLAPGRITPMSLVDVVREKQEALRVRDLARLLGVS
jgi:hypothetical protein